MCTEELRAQNETRFLRGRQIAFTIYEHLRATGAFDPAQSLSDLFNGRLQNDDVQDLDTRWDQALLSASEVPTEMVLKGLYKSKSQDSVQLQTTLAMYEQETTRNNEQPNYSRLMIAVRRHVDQQMRTRNFRARSEIVERGAVTKRPKGRKAVVERKVGECFQWKAIGQCSRGDSCSFSHEQASEADATRDKKNKRPLQHQKRMHRLTKSYPPKVQATEERSLLEPEADFRAELSSKEIARTRHVVIGTLPSVLITSLKQDAYMA